MATDFYERQSQARRSTKWLVVLFLLAVVSMVGLVFGATAWGTRALDQSPDPTPWRAVAPSDPWTLPLVAGVATLVLIGGASLYKINQLRGGGTAVAENVGGRRLLPNTNDPVERRLLNVVEEMALAAGVPVPPVFLLADEDGINAFAAGYAAGDAVVAVTRGTAEQLTREQLQGVVAHEFSHILNGDMRLNIRLLGILHGILVLGLVGRFLLRMVGSSRPRSSKNNNPLPLLLVGLALIVVGLLGTLIGNLIKAAVSRQREYLADASAVQFTRNPSGIAGALKRIGGAIAGSRLQHPNAAQMSHMYFGQGVWEGFSGVLATHPPLSKRILALEPTWDGKFLAATPAAQMEISGAAGLVGNAQPDSLVPAASVTRAAAHVAHPSDIHSRYAQQLRNDLPDPLLTAVHEPYGSRAVIFALLLDRNTEIRETQLQQLRTMTTPDIVALTVKLSPLCDALDARLRLPLIDLALPALRAMVKSQYMEFSQAFQAMVRADGRLSLFEWMLYRVLLRNLRPQFEKVAAPRIAYYGIQRLAAPCNVLLSALAHAGCTAEGAARSLAAAARQLPEINCHLLPADQCGLAQLEASLNELVRLAAKHRGRLIDACSAAICADQGVQVQEVELLRGIADMLDCPMPPLLAGQPLTPAS